MLFEKDYPLLATPEQLLDFIKDVEQATTCMPNLERYERISENRLLFVVTPRFSFVRTRLTMEWEIVSIGSKSGKLRLTGPQRVHIRGSGQFDPHPDQGWLTSASET